MKLKTVFFLCVLAASTTVFSQQKGDFSSFFGISYQLINNSDSGINAGFEYLIVDNAAIAPSFSYYFSPSGITTYSINADMRYYLRNSGKLKYYGIGGFSFLTIKTKVLGNTVTTNNIGVNAGGGAIIELNENLGILGQLKYDSSGRASIEPMIGITYKF